MRLDRGTNPLWSKWDTNRDAVARAAVGCWVPNEDLRNYLNNMPGPRLTATDVAQRINTRCLAPQVSTSRNRRSHTLGRSRLVPKEGDYLFVQKIARSENDPLTACQQLCFATTSMIRPPSGSSKPEFGEALELLCLSRGVTLPDQVSQQKR
jgi:hypothetical protein